MKENPPEKQSPEKWNDLFADPGASLDLLREKGIRSESTYPASLFIALWLDFFLVTGGEEVKAKWAALPPEEQSGLGVELLKCYLSQPLYIRLSEGKKLPGLKAPLELKSQGKFFLVEYGNEPDRQLEWLYPLDHQRFWPALFRVFKENFFTSEDIQKALEAEMIRVSSSRLEKIRRRADDLIALFSKGDINEIPEAPTPKDQPEWPPVRKDTPETVSEDVLSPEKLEPETPPPAVPDLSPSPASEPKRKKKKKTSMDQLELF